MFPHCRLPRHVTALYLYLVLNFVALFHLTLVNADVEAISLKSNATYAIFPDFPASFGKVLPSRGLKGLAVAANPPNACESLQPPPVISNYSGPWIVVIQRYDCSFADKIRAAQRANYDAAIVHNVGSNELEPMAAEDADDINIPSVFIGEDDGKTILARYLFTRGYALRLTDDLPFNLNNYLLPFAIVVGICFIVMLIFMIVKCVKDRRRQRRYRMPNSSLKKIPTLKYKKGDPYETCAICLEDYQDGDKLRVLPCSHAYHCKCIDPWLTRNRRVCPVCKRKVVANGERFTDSESDSDDENAPLLRPGAYGTQGGTFTPPAAEAGATVEGTRGVVNEGMVEVENENHSLNQSGFSTSQDDMYASANEFGDVHDVSDDETPAVTSGTHQALVSSSFYSCSGSETSVEIIPEPTVSSDGRTDDPETRAAFVV